MAQVAHAEHPAVSDLRGRLEGRLVVVEPLAPDHEAALFEAARDGALFDWLPEDLGASRTAVRTWIEWSLEASQSGREVPFTVFSTQSGKPVGSTRFHEIRLEHLRVEIGWTWLGKSAWGTGINVETKLLLLSRGFEEARCRRVEFKTDARNERSRGALEALGAKFEGILRKHMVVQQGGERDSAYYSVIDDEWPAVKANLQRRLKRAPGTPTRVTSS